MKIAILLGVSEYKNGEDLPACKNDVEIMTQLIKATGKYDNHILSISDNTSAAEVKSKITNKIDELKNKNVEEIFFYYSGHGNFYKNEFYYLLSDYDPEKRKQTSLENLEIDNWFRSLNPTMTIKVVDACNSGIMYVKEEGQKLEKYLNETLREFKKCYFMFSSNYDESSYIDEGNELSNFTNSFVTSFKIHESNEIRYKDIIDYVSDDFETKKDQTPFFVAQADFTEKFSQITSQIKDLTLLPTLNKTNPSAELQSTNGPKTLENIIKEDAKSYFSKEKVFSILENIQNHIQNYEYCDEFTNLYDINPQFMDLTSFDNTPNLSAVGKWFDEHEHDYFVKVKSEEVIKETPNEDNSLTKLMVQLNYFNASNTTKRIVNGFNLTVQPPYELIKIEAIPKYNNIPSSDLIITFGLSKTQIRFFYCFVTYKDINWDEMIIESDNIDWKTARIKFIDEENLINYITIIQNDFAKYIMTQLNERFGTKYEKKGKYKCGQKPGAGRYICKNCGQDLILDNDEDTLPPCANCNKCLFNGA
ncbi:MAG: caspase family protein [Methanobacterium paludis]|nr:caspase family protein [Methanobacterium paludis]